MEEEKKIPSGEIEFPGCEVVKRVDFR